MAKDKNKPEEPTTSLATTAPAAPPPVDDSIKERFPIMAMEPSGLKELVESNLGTGTLRAFDLPQLKIPGAGGTTWEVPSIEGTKNVQEVQGIILHWRDTRVRFPYEFGKAPPGVKNIPVCKSEDNIAGLGPDPAPGTLCAKCPHSQWQGDAPPTCDTKRLLFFLPEGEMLPMTLFLPQQSIKPCRNYFMGLMSKGFNTHSVITGITLSKETNPGGIKYAIARPRMVGKLTREQAAPILAYRQAMMPVFGAFSVEQDGQGYDGEGDSIS